MTSNFRFVCDFSSVIKYKAFDISQVVFAVPIRKIEFFYPILQYCQFLQNTVPRLNGRSKKKTYGVFGFRMKKSISRKLVFSIFEAQTQFYSETKKILKVTKFL